MILDGRVARLAVVAIMAGAAATVSSPSASAAPGSGFARDPASLVNPFIGTGQGSTFPGPDMPFGMIQWGPDTANPRQNGGGYNFDANQLLGFSLDRLSGAGCPVYGDVPILPTVGPVPSDPTDAVATFSHSSESAQVGFYQVTSNSPGPEPSPVTTQITSATHSAIARFTFPATTQADLLLKVADSAQKLVTSNGTTVPKYQKVFATSAQVVGNDQVTGSVTGGNFCNTGSDAHPNYTLHFDIRFDQPFTASATWPGGPGSDPGGVALTFDTTGAQTVTAKVGISYTSAANAALNLDAEIPGWDFAAVRGAAVQAWNNMLGRIQIAGGTPGEQTEFYTALYHALLDPHVYSDVNGQYMGVDGQVHTVAAGHAQYTDYSGWDIYRDQVQLLALLAPGRSDDIITSMLTDYSQDGMLPKWLQGNAESYEMVGDPADPIIADAYAFGARGFDTGQALNDMVAEATTTNNIRPGQQTLDQYGYLPVDMSYGCCHFYGGYVSDQLEYDTADYAIAAFAKQLGRQDIYARFASRAQNWQNAFNPATGYVQTKLSNGQWNPGFSPGTTTGFVEGTAAQYTPMIPFNLSAVIAAAGGTQAWNDFLDSLLSNITDPGPTNADISNEPSLVIPWEYDYTGAAWKTQQAVRQVQTELFADSPDGEPGADDLGVMSSWYVWSALGLYPATPGTSTLVTGSPLFQRAVVHLGNGGQLVIDAPAAAPGAPYVQNLLLNGHTWPKAWLSGNQYLHGATLTFELGTTPNTAWGSRPSAAPPSDGIGEAPALPYLSDSQVGAPEGQAATTTLFARNVAGRPIRVTASATAPPGITISAVPPLTLAAGTTGQATLQVSVSPNTPPGSYAVPVTLTAAGYTGHASASLLVTVSST